MCENRPTLLKKTRKTNVKPQESKANQHRCSYLRVKPNKTVLFKITDLSAGTVYLNDTNSISSLGPRIANEGLQNKATGHDKSSGSATRNSLWQLVMTSTQD